MMLRIVYFAVGLMVGIAWMGLGGLPYRLSQKVMAPLAATLRSDIDLHAPAELLAGYDQPRKIFIDKSLIDAPLNFTWNYISDNPSYGDATWIHYGSIGDEEEQFVLGYNLPPMLGERKKGLRASIAQLNVFKNKKIRLAFGGANRKLLTDFGEMGFASFGYKYNGLLKLCLAFQSSDYHNGFLLEGFYCAPAKKVPVDTRLTCLINSVKIYDEAYWLAPDSGKAERKSCDPAPQEGSNEAKAAVPPKAGPEGVNGI
ncbi:hypothetical protein [uncultured Cohaesibacter sp.]|uniref:hypothetical protein n=2 Tax=uncultured Cohaesibacter sp. TaxID=1002546 RepID=UPI003749E554